MKLTRTFSAAMRSLAARIGVQLAVIEAQPASVEPVPVPKVKPTKKAAAKKKPAKKPETETDEG